MLTRWHLNLTRPVDIDGEKKYKQSVLIYVDLEDSNGKIYETESKSFVVTNTNGKLTAKQIIDSLSSSFVQNELKIIARQIQEYYADYYDYDLTD